MVRPRVFASLVLSGPVPTVIARPALLRPFRVVIPAYVIEEELHRGRRSLLCRARRESDGATVILKTLGGPFPSPADVACLVREHEILRTLDLPGVVRALALERQGDRRCWCSRTRGASP